MLNTFISYFKNSKDERCLKQCRAVVVRINDLEASLSNLSDTALKDRTGVFKEQLNQGASLDHLLPEAFATVREASKRVLGMRHFDVQLIGGMVLHQGMIAEMRTGEGKTLVATLPVYLNALVERGVHVITVNDYLAQRDSEHMGHIYHFLGLSVGCITQDISGQQRYDAYHSDITYGTNNEFGFDYLRDNMKNSLQEMCQRKFYYAVVDEVDNILIDEARTPLIISGPSEESSELYEVVDGIIDDLTEEHYEKDEKHKSIAFTDKGFIRVEEIAKKAGLVEGKQLFQPSNNLLVHHLNQSLKAKKMFFKDVDYIVKDGKVILIDEFTGRMMKGRRFSDGLHQALEAKEKVKIEAENQTLASITFQNYFRMYPKLAGMTGTGKTEEKEFLSTYRLPVVAIPTNKPIMREDLDDAIFLNFEYKKRAIVQLIKECYQRKQPVLVGTVSIEKSEIFSRALKEEGVPHNVLNARHHEQEAHIIADAGMPGAVTIATNMAGRGTDIKLGGHLDFHLNKALEGEESEESKPLLEETVRKNIEEKARIAIEAGGLFVIGTERHESRRIDNQLRGRSGRQGDPGKSKFFISLEDDLMRIFAQNMRLMQYSLKGEKEDEPIVHPWITRVIEKAQQRIEAQHFDSRKHLLKYAEILNSHRETVYDTRQEIMGCQEAHGYVVSMINSLCSHLTDQYTSEKQLPDYWDFEGLEESLHRLFSMSFGIQQWCQSEGLTPLGLQARLESEITQMVDNIRGEMDPETFAKKEKRLLLKMLDKVWHEHLNGMDHLRQGIHLQAYGQKDPLNEYRSQAFLMFQGMVHRWHEQVLSELLHLQSSEEEMDWDDFFQSKKLLYGNPSDGNGEGDDEGGAVPEEDREKFQKLLQSLRQMLDEKGKDAEWKASLEKEGVDPEKLLESLESLGYPHKGALEDAESSSDVETFPSSQQQKVPPSRNDPCFCGSGKRYKQCHGKL